MSLKLRSNPGPITVPDDFTVPLAAEAGEEQGPKVLSALDIPARRRKQPLVVLFFGRRGQGKTLAMSALASMLQQRSRKAGSTMAVVSNYHLDFAAREDPYLLDELIEFPPWAYNLLVNIDEVATAFGSRRSMANINVLFSSFLTQIRKRNIEVMFTTQFPQVVDQQVLMQVDLFVRCEAVNGARSVRMLIHDWWGQYTGDMSRKPWPPVYGTEDAQVMAHRTDLVFGSYSTSEVIANVNSKRRHELIEQQWDVAAAGDEGTELDETPTPPANLEEAAEAMRNELGAFQVSRLWNVTPKVAPQIRSTPQLTAALKGLGYRVDDVDGIPVARKD